MTSALKRFIKYMALFKYITQSVITVYKYLRVFDQGNNI